MGLASLTAHVAGTILTAAALNSNFNAIVNQLNGNVEAVNIAALAVTSAKLATGAVTGAKIAMGSDATGDLLYHNGTNYVRKAIGSANDILRVSGGIPDWEAYTSLFLTPKEYTDLSDTDSSDQTTTSSTYSDTSQSQTFTVGKQGLVHAHFAGRGDSSSGICYFALLVDGTIVQEVAIPNGEAGVPVSLSWSGVLSAASHTIKVQFKNTDNVSTMSLKGTVVTTRMAISHPT